MSASASCCWLIRLMVVAIGLEMLGCSYVRDEAAVRRCFVPSDLLCSCVHHLDDGETHVRCIEAGLSELPNGFLNPAVLELRENGVEVIRAIEYPSLTQLRLSHNRIHRIDDYAFSKLENLTTLSLAHNHIGSLALDTFAGLRNLELLNLEDNHIFEIKSKVFTGMSRLQFIKLSRCRIHTIEPGSFAGLHKLFQLNISHNHIRTLPVLGDDSDLPWLSDLDLSNNKLRSLFSSSLKHLPSLKHLFLSRNHLTRLLNTSFPPSVQATLRSLWLRQNHLFKVDRGVFAQLKTLSTLDVAFNLLQDMDAAELPAGLDKVLVHDNPWDCSCGRNGWLVAKTSVREWNSESQVTCASPENMRGVDAFQIETISELRGNCDQPTEAVEAITSAIHGGPTPPLLPSYALWTGIGALAFSTVCLTAALLLILRARQQQRQPKRKTMLGGYIFRSNDGSTQRLITS